MQYIRLVTGPDGETRFEQVEVQAAPGGGQSDLSAPMPATNVVFVTIPPGFVRDWHPAPQRQFIVTLAGAGEVRDGTGEAHRLGIGSVLLVEDTEGKGHQTRTVSMEPWRLLWVTLGELRPAPPDVSQAAATSYLRIFAAPDGGSRFEDVTVEQRGPQGGSVRAAPIPATSILFRRSPADQHIDWHPAPRRQFVITLSGEAEVEATDGEVRHIGPGTVMLAGDTSGKGHITRGVGTADRLSLFVPLAD